MAATRIGMLTPSSNTVVEPTTQAIVAPLAGVSAHYARFKVTEISLSAKGLDQFEMAPFLAAAELLADARMHALAWNGTSAAWRGFDEDRVLCREIGERFGVPATASMLVLNQILRASGITRFGLVTPYTEDVQARILENYAAEGFECVAESHGAIQVNFDFAAISQPTIAEQVRSVARSKPAAILIVCTNLDAAGLVSALETELGIPIYDSLSAVVWHTLRLAGCDTRSLQAWGTLFVNPELNALLTSVE